MQIPGEETPDLRDYEEIICSDCRKPFVAKIDPTNQNKAILQGCNCQDKAQMFFPRGTIIAGFAGGLLTFYKPK
jgi:hypothetical protein